MDPLAGFSPPVRAWFTETFGSPTPPQAQGWDPIRRGEHTLILAPTGSGKTLAAFLWGIDQLYRERSQQTPEKGQPRGATAIRVVYVSPLKALNNDIQRNLEAPLAGIARSAQRLGLSFPHIRTAVRSGDTPPRERQAMLKHPPDILITTPESLYLLLTGVRAPCLFAGAHTVIIDEIHTLVGEKRGVHLALTLERLERAAGRPLQRIGLSATIQPLAEAARFLGGFQPAEAPQRAPGSPPLEPPPLAPRPVTIVDAHYPKAMDLRVVTPVEDFRHLAGGSVWPAIIREVARLIRQHRTTLIFCNTRRLAEQTADRLNEQFAAEARGEESGLIRDGVTVGRGMMATGTGGGPDAVRAHHGSVSREARLRMEHDLKSGELPALVATGSLELGIDIGAVDLVIQLQSPESVARGLQRIGRSGHAVGETSRGVVFPTHREDLLAAAAIAAGMRAGDVEPTRCPRHPLDVLAQQIVAMVAVEEWNADDLFHFVRRAYPYGHLTHRLFYSVIEMLAGRYDSRAHASLRPRLSWDRVNNRLAALPASKMLALSNGGTIPDRGTFTALLGDRKTRLGELDEEFVFETKVGDVFMLGSQTWRVTEITDDRL
ncbi:MAG: DEAD/DEAH box helicase, partial [Armatimonadota bacterium]|nr:DEAD/DEAH box helicase [Armatimonadota bacterium]